MIRNLIGLLALAATTIVALPLAAREAQPRDRWLSVEQVERDLALAEDAYRRVHPGYTRYATAEQMELAWQAIRIRAGKEQGMEVGDFYLAVELALTLIRCDHTKAELPRALRDARADAQLYLPFLWTLVEGRGLVELANGDSGLQRGDEILTVDGRSLAGMVGAVEKYIPVDGYTDWSRAGGVSQSGEFMGGAVDHFGALLWEVPAIAVIEVQTASGDRKTVSLDRMTFDQWRALGTTPGQTRDFKDAVQFERVGESAALLTIDTFVNYRTTVDPESLYGPIFAGLREEGRDTLILDLRKNGGGSTDASSGLASNLIRNARPFRKEMRVATLDHSPWEGQLTTWDTRALNPDPRGFIANNDGSFTLRDGVLKDTAVLQPTDNAFDGRLIVLTSRDNSSGSTNLLANIATRSDTITVGEKTGGSAEGPNAGVIFFLTLPESGVKVRIPMFRQFNNIESFEKGLGITPQIEARMTVAAFRSGLDPAMEKALEIASRPRDEAAEQSAAQVTLADLEVLLGDGWTGELDYLNYGSDSRSSIPVKGQISPRNSRSITYAIQYPGEESNNTKAQLKISRGGSKVNGYTVSSRRTDADGLLAIETIGEGRDDNRAAQIRITYFIGPATFRVRKDVKFDDGDWFNRNEYRLTR